MNAQAEELNQIIQLKNPVIYQLLSEKGKAIFFPAHGILGQTADAKGTTINATIGAAFEDDGSPMHLESISRHIDLPPEQLFPYAPSFGRMDIRKQWQQMIKQKNPSLQNKSISLPVVTNALTHAVSMAGYLFVDPGDSIIIPDLFWGNYNLILNHGYGGTLQKFAFFDGHQFNLKALEESLQKNGTGKKILILNFPNNPTGYTPTQKEAEGICQVVKKSAEAGNKIVVLSDDAYFGLNYEPEIAGESIFARLCDLHDNILAVKIDGPTKEDYVWGFRVGFLSFGNKKGDQELYRALESKAAGAIRGNISNACNVSQSLLLTAFNDPSYPAEKKEKFAIMNSRYQTIKEELKSPQYAGYFTPLPFNSGYFMCIRLREEIDGEKLRQLLIKKYHIGVINLNNLIRIAYSAVAAKDVKALFEGICQACKELCQ